jgi:hypothetical protein
MMAPLYMIAQYFLFVCMEFRRLIDFPSTRTHPKYRNKIRGFCREKNECLDHIFYGKHYKVLTGDIPRVRVDVFAQRGTRSATKRPLMTLGARYPHKNMALSYKLR